MTNQNITKPNEIWKPIAGHAGSYEVSNFGRVRSLDRVVFCKDNKQKFLRGQVLTPQVSDGGYMHVTLYENGENNIDYVHRLVLAAFAGHASEDAVCMHHDNDRANNHIDNLKWGTPELNMKQRCDMTGLLKVSLTAWRD